MQTLGCGIERITGVETDDPKSKLVYTFPGNWCGVPTIVGHYLVESVRAIHGLVVLDIANGAKPVEVSRLKLSDTYIPHWTAWDAKTERVVATSGETPGDRTYLLKFDPATGALTIDTASATRTEGRLQFRRPQWPHRMEGRRLSARSRFTR